MCPLVLLYTLTLSYALKFPSVPKGVVQVLKVKTWCLILSSPYDTHIMLFVSCPHVIISHRRCTPRRMNQSPTQWQPHPAAQEASPTRPPPPSPPPPSPPSTRASSQTPSLMRRALGTTGKVPSGSAGIWRCKFPRRPGMSASVRDGCQVHPRVKEDVSQPSLPPQCLNPSPKRVFIVF